jgi:hypothetical protein
MYSQQAYSTALRSNWCGKCMLLALQLLQLAVMDWRVQHLIAAAYYCRAQQYCNISTALEFCCFSALLATQCNAVSSTLSPAAT